MTSDDYYLEPFAQTTRLAAILTAHTDASGAIPAAVIPALTTDLRELLGATRRSGYDDGYEEASSEQ